MNFDLKSKQNNNWVIGLTLTTELSAITKNEILLKNKYLSSKTNFFIIKA